MLRGNTIWTIVTKFIILLLNFFLVVFTTQIWGTEGRGKIALVIANISIIAIFSNVFCGSTVAYHSGRERAGSLLGISLVWAIIISFAGAFVFSGIFGFSYFWQLLLISLLISLTNAISYFWLGKSNIKDYNLLTLYLPVFILTSLVILYFVLGKTSLNTFFLAYGIGTGVALTAGITGLLKKESLKFTGISIEGIKSIFNYGINNEFNYLIQFLNYRLSYYFVASMLGLTQLGIFSIVVSASEAVWIISNSMSTVHYSNVINSDDRIKNRHETVVLAKQTFLISAAILCISVLVPRSVYEFVFGNEFGDVRKLIIFLIPGIISVAVSNLYDQYFAGVGKLKILRDKSLIGLAAFLVLLPLLIKKYDLAGACISMDVSYILSSLYLWFRFRKEGKESYPVISA